MFHCVYVGISVLNFLSSDIEMVVIDHFSLCYLYDILVDLYPHSIATTFSINLEPKPLIPKEKTKPLIPKGLAYNIYIYMDYLTYN